MPSLGVEWINDYDWLPQLHHEHEVAGGFYNELVKHAGWITHPVKHATTLAGVKRLSRLRL